ncbi:hypothetical protein CcCBS67573_g08986 [Chytriomyces confervae]|uniref:EF-hand domain-containing protein n=1 Tax=Chytriomyces confervae TaxID=246404 RepID=A0A507E972_9FUNG|nr:hypothetical protein CcCBS67573_g08986 [Chytriomyces confervae]
MLSTESIYLFRKAYMGSEVSAAQIRDLHRNNISSRNFLTPELSNLKWSSRSIRLGAAKVASILSSPFEKVLFLDPDVMPLQDPTFLFTTHTFNKTGALFWPDVRPTSSDQKIWEITQQPFEFEFEFESGQIVLDKGNVDVFMGLSVAHYMCAEAEFYFRHLWGDKDTFRWGFRVAGVPYFLNKEQVASVGVIADERMRIGNVKLDTNSNPTNPESLNAPLFSYLNTSLQGTIPNTRNARYCGQNMLQFDFNDDPNVAGTNSIARKPLFMHANGIKQFYKRGVHPFQVVQVYVLPNKTKSLTDYEKGMYDWMDRVYGQQHCGKLMEMEGLSTAFLNFSAAYPGVNERYSRARDKAIKLWCAIAALADQSNYGNVNVEAERYKSDSVRQMQDVGGNTQGHQKEIKSVDDMILFFQLHDHNKDGHLDGHELLTVYAGQELKVGSDGRPVHANSPATRLSEIKKLVDVVLDMDDTDNDGMISWEEYYGKRSFCLSCYKRF